MDFKNWLEYADYGFEKKQAGDNVDLTINREAPVHRFDVEELFTYLAMRKLGPHKPKARFVNEMVWGEDAGATRVRLNGDLQLYLDKKGVDLEGNVRWLTHKTLQINRDGYGGYEDMVANEVFEHIENIYYQPIDVPCGEFKELERLVIRLAEKMEKVAPEIFIFENITKMDDNRYLVSFSFRGAGVGAPDQLKCNQNITEVIYNPSTGTIRIFNSNLESRTGGGVSWSLGPVDHDFCFFPSQDQNEIIEVMAVPIKFY